MTYPLRLPAIRVDQALGTFFVTVVRAKVLLDTCYSDHLRADLASDSGMYVLDGTQRLLRSDRIRDIGQYISRLDSSFPNSIILAANVRSEDGLIDEDSDHRWTIAQVDGSRYELVIPSDRKNAAVVDGQHRLFAFAHAIPARLNTDLICSVFVDLPKPLQASLFATINSTQTPVSKSQTYELFGYNVEEEAAEYWSPDKLAVFLARRLALDEESPLRGRIMLAPEQDFLVGPQRGARWGVSIAVIVQGILRLISSNPRQDTNALLKERRRTRSEIADLRSDKSPLREQYLETNDTFIYKAVLNFLVACEHVLWADEPHDSFITKTVGVQATFDLFRLLLPKALEDRNLRVDYFEAALGPARGVDFTGIRFRNASGSGRTYMRKVLAIAAGLEPADSIPAAERQEIGLA